MCAFYLLANNLEWTKRSRSQCARTISQRHRTTYGQRTHAICDGSDVNCGLRVAVLQVLFIYEVSYPKEKDNEHAQVHARGQLRTFAIYIDIHAYSKVFLLLLYNYSTVTCCPCIVVITKKEMFALLP